MLTFHKIVGKHIIIISNCLESINSFIKLGINTCIHTSKHSIKVESLINVAKNLNIFNIFSLIYEAS